MTHKYVFKRAAIGAVALGIWSVTLLALSSGPAPSLDPLNSTTTVAKAEPPAFNSTVTP